MPRWNPGVYWGFPEMPGLKNRAIYAVFGHGTAFFVCFQNYIGKEGVLPTNYLCIDPLVKLDYPEADSPSWFSIFQGRSDMIEWELAWSGLRYLFRRILYHSFAKKQHLFFGIFPSLSRFSDWEHEYSGKKLLTAPVRDRFQLLKPGVMGKGKKGVLGVRSHAGSG